MRTPTAQLRFATPRRLAGALLMAVSAAFAGATPSLSQTLDPWAGVEAPAQPPSGNTTVIERAGPDAKSAEPPGVKLVALLTSDGQQIDQGVVWRIYQPGEAAGKSKLVSEVRQATPSVKLPPGDYVVNAAFGRAHLTKKITVNSEPPQTVQFVLNAGGLRVNAFVGGKTAAQGAVSYAIYSDDRDQFDNRTAVMTGAKPNLIIRLNAGIYRIMSTYGDANARVEADVTVEAGKLTEATISHAAGRAMFKLVTRSGGEAIPDTTWVVQSAAGETIKESVGALPSHYLAPGQYTVAARSGGQVFGGKFDVKDGETTVVEVLRDGAASPEAAGRASEPADGAGQEEGFNIKPSFDFKSP
jgi:hypothetical protein